MTDLGFTLFPGINCGKILNIYTTMAILIKLNIVLTLPTNMIKLLLILYLIKLYAHINNLKKNARGNHAMVLEYWLKSNFVSKNGTFAVQRFLCY